MTSVPQARFGRGEILLIAALTALAFLLRLHRLSAQSLWIDEVLMIQRASLGEPFRWSDWLVNPQGPLPALILRWWTSAFGTTEAALRFPSVIFGTATVPMIYALARRLAPAAALPAAILAAVSPFLIWYSQETRHYALAIFAAAWSAWAVLRFEAEGAGRGRILHGFLSLLTGFMSNLTMLFAAGAQTLALLGRSRPRAFRWLVGAAIPAFILFLPWFWMAATRNINFEHVTATGEIPVTERLRGESTFSWFGLPYTAFVFFAGYSLGPSLTELHEAPRPATVLPHLPVVLPLAAGVLLLVVAGYRELSRNGFQRNLVILWIVLPLLSVVLLALRNAKVFNPRYLAIALPLILAVMGLGSARLSRSSRWALAAAWLLVLVPTAVSLSNYYRGGKYGREDMRGVAAALEEAATKDDLIIAQGAPQVLAWYYDGVAPVQVVYDVWVQDPARLESRVDEWVAGRHRIWLVISRPWLQDPEYRLKRILDRRFTEAKIMVTQPGVLVVQYPTVIRPPQEPGVFYR
jgi:mannosyltransferase